jgi:hypothetical protein
MQTIYIKTPIWKAGGAVGIRAEFLAKGDCIVEILYEDRFGNRVYPGKYLATREKIVRMERQVVGNNTNLIIFPISELERLKEDDEAKVEYFRSIGL